MNERLVIVFVCLAAQPVFAQSTGQLARPEASFWQEVSSDDLRAARALLARWLHSAEIEIWSREDFGRAAGLLALRRDAVRGDVGVAYWYATFLARSGAAATLQIDAWQHVRALDPLYAPDEVAAQLGIVFAGENEYASACEEYERALAYSTDEAVDATTHGNLGEALMLLGKLEEAVSHYDAALRAALATNRSGRSLALAYFGRAVARDRLGEHDAALADARSAMALEGIGVLHDPGVFFSPEWEIHWYEALGHEAAAGSTQVAVAGMSRNALSQSQRAQLELTYRNNELLAARNSWRAYLRVLPARHATRPLAERRLRDVELQFAAAQAEVRRRPRSR